jgi:hypothetical protein
MLLRSAPPNPTIPLESQASVQANKVELQLAKEKLKQVKAKLQRVKDELRAGREESESAGEPVLAPDVYPTYQPNPGKLLLEGEKPMMGPIGGPAVSSYLIFPSNIFLVPN